VGVPAIGGPVLTQFGLLLCPVAPSGNGGFMAPRETEREVVAVSFGGNGWWCRTSNGLSSEGGNVVTLDRRVKPVSPKF